MSVTVFARDRRKKELRVVEGDVVHRVTQMYISLGNLTPNEQPYAAECGILIVGCTIVDVPVDCLNCLAGEDALIEGLKKRLGQ